MSAQTAQDPAAPSQYPHALSKYHASFVMFVIRKHSYKIVIMRVYLRAHPLYTPPMFPPLAGVSSACSDPKTERGDPDGKFGGKES